MSYFLFHMTEDGLQAEGPMAAAELEAKLEPLKGETCCYYGDLVFFKTIGEVLKYSARDGHKIPACIIKGEGVLPQAVAVVTKVELP